MSRRPPPHRQFWVEGRGGELTQRSTRSPRHRAILMSYMRRTRLSDKAEICHTTRFYTRPRGDAVRQGKPRSELNPAENSAIRNSRTRKRAYLPKSFYRSELSLALLLRSDCEWARSVVPNKLGSSRAGVFRLGAVVGLDFQLRML